MVLIKKSLALSVSSAYSIFIVNIISVMIVSRILTPEEIGIYSVCAAVVGTAAIIRNSGIGEYLIQARELNPDHIRTGFGVWLIVSWLLALVLWLSRGWVAEFYAEPAMETVLLVLLISFVLVPFGAPAISLLRREMAFGTLYCVGVSSAIAHAVVTVSLAMAGYSYLSPAWGGVAGIATSILVMIILRRDLVLLTPNLKELRRVISFGLPVLGGNICVHLDRSAVELVIGRILGFTSVALLNRALSVRDLFGRLVMDGVSPVVMPAFAASDRAGEDLKALYLTATSNLLAVAWPFFAVQALMALPIINLLFGDQWDAAAPLLVVFCLAGAISLTVGLAPDVLTAIGQVNDLLKMRIFVTVIRLGLIIPAAMHSMLAVAWVFPFTNMIGFAILMILIRRHIGAGLGDFLSYNWRTLAVTLIAGFPALASVVYLDVRADAYMMPLILTAILTPLAWLAAVYVCRHSIAIQINLLFSRLASWRDAER